MNNILNEASFGGRKGLRLIGLIANAYDDYITARILFNNGKLRQACVMANQCLEKQMKAYIETQNDVENTSHDTIKIHNTMVYYNYPVASLINKDFIRVINNIYKTRYFEQLSSHYHYTIVQYKFLAELDYIMSEFLPKIKVKPQSSNIKSSYEFDIEKKSQDLYLNNYILNGVSKSDFLIQDQLIEYFLLYGNSPITLISIGKAADNNKFIYPGMKVTSPVHMQLIDWGLEEFGIPTFQKEK